MKLTKIQARVMSIFEAKVHVVPGCRYDGVMVRHNTVAALLRRGLIVRSGVVGYVAAVAPAPPPAPPAPPAPPDVFGLRVHVARAQLLERGACYDGLHGFDRLVKEFGGGPYEWTQELQTWVLNNIHPSNLSFLDLPRFQIVLCTVRRDRLRLGYATLNAVRFESPDIRLMRCDLDSCRWGEQSSYVTAHSSLIYRCAIRGASSVQLSWRRCNAPHLQLSRSSVTDSQMKQVNLTYLRIADSSVAGSTFDQVEFKYMTATNATFQRCTFKLCSFEGADLTGATFKGCTFRSCDFSGCQLTRDFADSLEDADLTGAKVIG